jgi:hypothetical protein
LADVFFDEFTDLMVAEYRRIEIDVKYGQDWILGDAEHATVRLQFVIG